MKRIVLLAILLWSIFSPMVVHAISIGYISFDSSIPGPGGVNTVTINNLTGNPASGGSALPPDFPVFDSLFLTNSMVTLSSLSIGGSTVVQDFLLGDIGPGFFPDPSGILQFPDTTNFFSATFTATLNQTSFLLSDGSTFVAASPLVSVTLLPASGSFLVAGSDLALIDVSPVNVAPVPEPGTWLMLGSGLVGLWMWGRRKTSGRMNNIA